MAAFRRTLCLAALAVGILAHVSARADGDGNSGIPRHRTLVFSPDRPERCDYFFVTEFNASAISTKPADDRRSIFTDALGLMRNVGRTRAVGAEIQLHRANDDYSVAPALRYKQWLRGRQSLDLSLGYADKLDRRGLAGPILTVAYSPTQWVHVQSGVCRVRTVIYSSTGTGTEVREENTVRFSGGVGLGAAGGIVAWGAQAIVFGVLLAAFKLSE